LTDGTVPRPGSPVRGSSSGRPIMAALDLLGRRWVLRLVWELNQRPAGFRDLQRRCGDMSSSVLSTRLLELRTAGIVTTAEDGTNRLAPRGTALVAALGPLMEWAEDWAEAAGPPA
jgi:DNA-binding HxlR family transcriptional regulator